MGAFADSFLLVTEMGRPILLNRLDRHSDTFARDYISLLWRAGSAERDLLNELSKQV